MKLIEHFVGGKIIPGTSDKKGKVFNPATGEQEKEVRLASKSDLDQAVVIAKKAFDEWSLKPSLQRARIMFKFKELIEKNSDELTQLIVAEHGKVYEDAKGSLTRGLEVVEFACGIPHLLKGEFSENVGTNVDSWSIRQPLGVVAGITPFNFPAMVPMWMFPIAIACGNTFILKPSEKDPSCSIRLAELLKEAGLPDGVFNVVNGDKEAVDAILTNIDIKAVSFVGSTPIAKYIYENSAKNEKRVQALGGAKNHLVVMPDCDLDGAVNGLMGAAYGSAGERCMAQSVAVAVGDIGDELVSRLSKKAEALKVGPGMDKNSEMGPLVTKEHLEKVKGYVDLGVKEGAKLLVAGFVIWLLSIGIMGLFGVSVQFPFTITEEGELPYYRWQGIRLAVFFTLAYFGIQYVLGLSKEVYPISFVKVYLFNMCFFGIILMYRLDVPKEEYLIPAFWLAFLLILNLATTNRYRRLFKKK